uniref:Uncharacterized protein n=1 Tax=Cucumis sativus TaxID=3659 RepID=A0A0A0KQU7_CUCSA
MQAIVLKSYPMGLIVTFLVCIVGVVEGTVIAVVMEWNNPSVWSIHFDFQLLAILYAVSIIYQEVLILIKIIIITIT